MNNSALRAAKKPAHRKGEVLVRFRAGVSQVDKDIVAATHGARRKKQLRGKSQIEKLELTGADDPAMAALQLSLNPAVEFAEPNFIITPDQLDAVTANDSRFSEQWALNNTGQNGGQYGSDIGVTTAWRTTTGSQAAVIAVIDSGVDFTHPDLINNEWTNPNPVNGDVHGWDFITDTGDIKDEQGHGTAIAGIIAAEGNNTQGVCGVMWRASLMSLRVLDNTGTGDIANAVEAIDYAAAQGAQVINLSWGTNAESVALKDAIKRAISFGAVVVCSAGNNGQDLDAVPYYPASFAEPGLIAVAAADSSDQLASWSNWGQTKVTVAAPGTNILTTKMGGGYWNVSGTSASAPFVTGVAGLIKTIRPALAAQNVAQAIRDGVRPTSSLSGKVSSGGVVSASGALNVLQEPGPAPTPTPTPTPDDDPAIPTDDPGAPGSGMPDLDTARNQQPPDPVAPSQIHADLPCLDCDPCGGSCGGEIPEDPDFSVGRNLPGNRTGQPGVTLGSRNFNWGIPLVGLPGRSGLDLDLSLSYNSLVWTRENASIKFNADHGQPTAGFRIGFPVIQQRYTSSAGSQAYMMVTPSGSRVELRQVGASTIYEAADGSYTQMTDLGASGALVKTADGTQLTFTPADTSGEMHCSQIKDRNGNYLSATYDASGRISTATDTLNRIFTFNYDVNNYLISITQTWAGVAHTWATFSYGTLVIQTNFSGLSVVGPPNGTSIGVLTQVGLSDGTRYNFEYTSWGQVYRIRHYAQDNHQLTYTTYNLPLNNSTAQADCPRFTERRDWAQNWNSSLEAVTAYSVAGDGSWSQQTMPDGTIYKELYYTGGWQSGLTYQSEIWSSSVRKKWTTMAWTQDDTALSYQLNPRPTDVNIYDEAGNRRRTTVSYYPTTSYSLPSDVYEYDSNASTVLRRTHTDYNLSSTYTSRRIIGLVSMRIVYSGSSTTMSKVEHQYDEGGAFFVNQGVPARHDSTNYGTTFLAGRGNLTSIRRWDANYPTDATKVAESNLGYNTAGLVILAKDARAHQTSVSYTDSFSDTTKNSLNTLAYPTRVTDADGFYSTAEYNYDFGAVTKTSRASSGTGAGITYEDLTYTYDTVGRTSRVTDLENNAYTRWVYPTSNILVQQYQTISSTAEAYSTQILDGAGRVRGVSAEHPGSSGLYQGQYFIYDVMGRLWKQSNPTEMNSAWAAVGDDVAGWKYTIQTYDWKGRPLLTTNTDNTTRANSYDGCGCAGGEEITTTDERGRQKRASMDVLGRLAKVEELNWNATVYATTTYAYNARDQITQSNQAGQLRTFAYDGHGRQQTRTTPEQGTTSYTYFADDAVQTVTDARGATATFAYNNRHLPTSITYGVPAGVAATPSVSFAYDAAGNRTSMTDGMGSVSYSYNTLSQLTSETRTFTSVGSFTLGYAYNLGGELTSLTNPSGSVVGYAYDKTGRVTGVSGSGAVSASSYASLLKYRAFGAIKGMSYGDGKTLTTAYDNRLRPTTWNVSNVLGYNYNYDYLGEHTGLVSYAGSIYDSTLDRSYEYDNVGRLVISHSGAEARAHAYSGQWGTMDGPYSQGYDYDVWGNVTHKYGWGGEVQGGGAGQSSDLYYTYTNNRRNGFSYDAAGNLTNDLGQTFTYDATGQQATASYMSVQQSYDGNGLRVKKTENGQTTYYLRSSVLGGQVVAEMDSSGAWTRGYVYLGGSLLAVQDSAVYWMHEDPVTKSKRVTDATGTIVSTVELDPWGADTSRSSNATFQPRKFTSYERDANGTDEAMFRRYNRWQSRFDQPDPYDGSYSLADPQSFNRYAYTQNDPVNFTDPTGTMMSCSGLFLPGREVGFVYFGDICSRIPDDWYDGPKDPNIPTNPQKPAPEQRAADRAGQMLAQQRCGDFVRKLLLKADQLAIPTFGGPIRTNFSAPLGQNGQPEANYPPANYALSLYRTALAQGNVSRATTHQGDANTIGVTSSRTLAVQWNAEFYGLSLDEQAQHTIHESIHQIPTFDDYTLARAAGLVSNGREPSRNDLRSVSSASQYLNGILFQYCH